MSITKAIRETIGDYFPNAANMGKRVATKLGNNNIIGRIKFQLRSFKVSIYDATTYLKHQFQDVGLHFKRMNKRQAKIHEMLTNGYVPTEQDFKDLFARGDGRQAKREAEGFKKAAVFLVSHADAAIQQSDARAKGEDDVTKARHDAVKLATGRDNLKVIEAESEFATNNPNWRTDWDRHLVVHGKAKDGIAGVATLFRSKMTVANGEGKSMNLQQYHTMLLSALQDNRESLQVRHDELDSEIANHIDEAMAGVSPAQPQSLKTLELQALAEALSYTESCIADEAKRQNLLDAYKSALGISSSITPFLEAEPKVANARKTQAERLVIARNKLLDMQRQVEELEQAPVEEDEKDNEFHSTQEPGDPTKE